MFPTTSGWYLGGALASPWASGALLEPSLTLYSVTLPDPAQCEPPPSSPQGSARPTRSTQHPMYGTSYALPPQAVFHCHFQALSSFFVFFSVFRHFPHPHIFIFEWHLHFFCKKKDFFFFCLFCFLFCLILHTIWAHSKLLFWHFTTCPEGSCNIYFFHANQTTGKIYWKCHTLLNSSIEAGLGIVRPSHSCLSLGVLSGYAPWGLESVRTSRRRHIHGW